MSLPDTPGPSDPLHHANNPNNDNSSNEDDIDDHDEDNDDNIDNNHDGNINGNIDHGGISHPANPTGDLRDNLESMPSLHSTTVQGNPLQQVPPHVSLITLD
ncbi:hypothetical protein FRC02_011453 [Tulasnella sp. 418]|nr:hypothetical protein FRC02_011453 [Tulasnella sp. 418]